MILGLVLADGYPAAAEDISSYFRDDGDLSWKRNESTASRWKTMIGGHDGGQIDEQDIRFGVFELAPRAVYHGHRHDSPEIYYITAGHALWTVGNETREVSTGTTIYIPSGTVHKMTNQGEDTVEAIWVWWAPNGEREIFDGEYRFVEEAPVQPEGAGFRDGTATRSH